MVEGIGHLSYLRRAAARDWQAGRALGKYPTEPGGEASMSDTLRASTATGQELSSRGLASAEQPIGAKKRWAHRMWNVGRVLILVSSLAFVYAAWLP